MPATFRPPASEITGSNFGPRFTATLRPRSPARSSIQRSAKPTIQGRKSGRSRTRRAPARARHIAGFNRVRPDDYEGSFCTPRPAGTKKAALLTAWMSDSNTTASRKLGCAPIKWSASQISSEVARHWIGCQINNYCRTMPCCRQISLICRSISADGPTKVASLPPITRLRSRVNRSEGLRC